MVDKVLQQVEEKIQEAKDSLDKAKYLREFLVEVGEDTTEITRRINEAEDKVERYEKALKRRKPKGKRKG